jgi:type I restriction enzyme, S subunit
MAEWRRSTWGEEITLEYGKALRDYSTDLGRVRVYGSNGPIGWTDRQLAEGPGVILGRKGAYRGVRFSRDAFFVIDTAYYVVPKTELDMRWIYYAIIFHNLGKIDDGSPIPSTTRAAVYPIPLRVPPIAEQRAIASVLGALDDKIEQNQHTSLTLERLAQAIFRAWFVDFEAVKAKALGSTAFPSMRDATFNALPNTFVESELGMIPEGWRTSPIGDVVTVKGGATPSTKIGAYWEEGNSCWATPKDLSRLSVPVLLDTERRITDAGVAQISSGVLPVGTVLLSSRAPVGYLAIASVPTAINQGFIAMVCDGTLPSSYVFNWTRHAMGEIKGRASGTTFAEISKASFRPIPIVVPTAPVIEGFQELVDPLFDLLTATARETSKLRAMRDYLLPGLLSGQVRLEVRHG